MHSLISKVLNFLQTTLQKEGEESLFNEINSESEVGINNDDYPDCEILEAALYGSNTLDEMMDQWNEKWI